MNLQDAFYQTVHSYEGGCEVLAVRMNMSAAILRNKANPNTTTNLPSAKDLDDVVSLTRNPLLVHTFAANHGFVCVRVPDDVDASDMAVLEMVTKVWTTNGEVGAEVNKALADGRITRREIEQVRAAVKRAERALEEVAARLAGMAEK